MAPQAPAPPPELSLQGSGVALTRVLRTLYQRTHLTRLTVIEHRPLRLGFALPAGVETVRIRREEAQDVPKVHAINVAAFGSAAEADIVDVLRSDAHHVVSLVAEDDGEIVGHVMFSPVRVVGASDLRAMALAPMAVISNRQRSTVAKLGSVVVSDPRSSK